MSDHLADRGQTLEDSFFHQRDRELLAKLKEQAAAGDASKELALALGVEDSATIDKLISLGIKPEMALAVSMVPLVQVAWADGSVADSEKEAVMSAAEKSGIEDGTPAHGILLSWLANEPSEALATAWREYIGAVVKSLSAAEKESLKEVTLHRAKTVAGVAGGILGLGSKFSGSEKAVLEDLAKAFG